MSIVKSFSVGNGDMFYIKHNTDNFTTIDCCYDSELNRLRVLNEIAEASKDKGITRFISTHPDEDHIKGLKEYDSVLGIVNFYCVKNEATKDEESEDFKEYCKLRDGESHFYLSKYCTRKWMNESDETRKSAGLTCLWPDLVNDDYKEALTAAKKGESPNNISPIIKYSEPGCATFLWMGDLETDFQEMIKHVVEWPKVDVLFAPHHGRDSGKIPEDVLRKLDPKIIVIGEAPSDTLNYYSNYNTITQNSAGDIIFECKDNKVYIYVSKDMYVVNYLKKEEHPDLYGHYIGTLIV